MNEKDELLYSRAIKAFGIENQKRMFIEESAELVKELLKEFREIGNTNKIIEEIVDVQIVLDQLKLIYCSDINLYKKVRLEKINRLQHEINKKIE